VLAVTRLVLQLHCTLLSTACIITFGTHTHILTCALLLLLLLFTTTANTCRTVLNDAPFTPYAGHVGGFGVLVDGIGRGLPRSIACGKEYTVVATFPYEGPVMDVAVQLMEEFALEEEELQLLQQEVRTCSTTCSSKLLEVQAVCMKH
jgi:hypothetical protein